MASLPSLLVRRRHAGRKVLLMQQGYACFRTPSPPPLHPSSIFPHLHTGVVFSRLDAYTVTSTVLTFHGLTRPLVTSLPPKSAIPAGSFGGLLPYLGVWRPSQDDQGCNAERLRYRSDRDLRLRCCGARFRLLPRKTTAHKGCRIRTSGRVGERQNSGQGCGVRSRPG